MLDLHDEVQGQRLGLARLEFEAFSLHLVPNLLKLEEDESAFSFSSPFTFLSFVTEPGSTEPLSRAELEVLIGEYSLSILEPGPTRHPDFLHLVPSSPAHSSFHPITFPPRFGTLPRVVVVRVRNPCSG